MTQTKNYKHKHNKTKRRNRTSNKSLIKTKMSDYKVEIGLKPFE